MKSTETFPDEFFRFEPGKNWSEVEMLFLPGEERLIGIWRRGSVLRPASDEESSVVKDFVNKNRSGMPMSMTANASFIVSTE